MDMEIDNAGLLEILIELDKYLPRKIKVIAIGGTALTLLGKKASTKDIDFCFITESDKKIFEKTAANAGYSRLSAGKLANREINIDIYSSGYIFCVQLPADYEKKAVKIRSLQKLEIYALNLMDLLITKASRFNNRDKEDILTILRSYDINQSKLVDRWIMVMENSIVKDAKEHLIRLLELFALNGKNDDIAIRKATKWSNE